MLEAETPLPCQCLEPRFQTKALVRKKALSAILKLRAKRAKIAFSGDDNHLFFGFGDRLLLCRKLSGNFPDFERVLPKEHAHSVKLEKDELRGTIERVAQFSDERSRAIRLQVAPGGVKIYSSLSHTGESEESMTVDYKGAAVEIGSTRLTCSTFCGRCRGRRRSSSLRMGRVRARCVRRRGMGFTGTS